MHLTCICCGSPIEPGCHIRLDMRFCFPIVLCLPCEEEHVRFLWRFIDHLRVIKRRLAEVV